MNYINLILIKNNFIGNIYIKPIKINIDLSTKKKPPYLFVHVRNEHSKAEIIYICEIFN